MTVVAIAVVAGCLLVAIAIRSGLPVLGRARIPASLIAGTVLLAAIQTVDAVLPGDQTVANLTQTLADWPGPLIAVVFAAMLLPPRSGRSAAVARAADVGRQGLMVWIIVLGQTAVGLLTLWLVINRFEPLPPAAGMLIEAGFAGGHGTAAAMGLVFKQPPIEFDAGLDLGLLIATAGLGGGLVLGIGWIAAGRAVGWVDPRWAETDIDDLTEEGRTSIGSSRVDPEATDPLLFQLMWLALAMGVGVGLAAGVDALAATGDPAGDDSLLDQKRSLAGVAASMPLFIYTLAGGWLVNRGLRTFGLSDRIDALTIRHVSASAMDVLVIAAVGTLNLQAAASLWLPVVCFVVAGLTWSSVCLLVLARRILPEDRWFALGLINFGMSTGTTATGFVLLRVVDPNLRSGAAEDYALAAPLSAPFVGGGILTVAIPLMLLPAVPLPVAAVMLSVMVAGLVAAAIWWRRRAD